MSVYYEDASVTVYHGDCLDVLRGLPDASMDSVCTDPPYSYAFMNRHWDSHPTPRAFQAWCELWAAECLRVLKPGGMILAFGGSRTSHRLAAAIEDAGFEIRDTITHMYGRLVWCYASGFPKSLAVSRDPRFCQCLSGVRDAAAEDAAESAAEVLLEGLRVSGQADVADLADLRGVPLDLHPDYALPSGAQPDMFAGVRGSSEWERETGQAAGAGPGVPTLRGDVHSQEQYGEGPREVLLDVVRRPGEDGGPGVPDEPAGGWSPGGRGAAREAAPREVRGGEPSVEGRGDLQATEGELHRPSVRQVSAGVTGDGESRRLHHGAPAGNGVVGGASAEQVGVREPHRPQSEEQRSLEPGVVSEQRGSQAGRGWPLCAGCGKPMVPAGLGTALKPAHEPIVVARKPLGESTVAGNVLRYGTGALNIDACRVGSDVRTYGPSAAPGGNGVRLHGGDGRDVENARRYAEQSKQRPETTVAGRWPSNVVLSHHETCEQVGTRRVRTSQGVRGASTSIYGGGKGFTAATGEQVGYADADGRESVPLFACVAGCPVAELDAQSGERPSGADPTRRVPARGAETGNASRFFPAFRFEAKAPTLERPRDGVLAHPTTKPLDLIRWLVRLVTPPGGTCLDPFAGSGTTVEACILERFRCIAIEREADYLPLIRQRITRRRDPVAYHRDTGTDAGTLFEVAP